MKRRSFISKLMAVAGLSAVAPLVPQLPIRPVQERFLLKSQTWTDNKVVLNSFVTVGHCRPGIQFVSDNSGIFTCYSPEYMSALEKALFASMQSRARGNPTNFGDQT